MELAGGVQPASPTPTRTRQISIITNPLITTPTGDVLDSSMTPLDPLPSRLAGTVLA